MKCCAVWHKCQHSWPNWRRWHNIPSPGLSHDTLLRCQSDFQKAPVHYVISCFHSFILLLAEARKLQHSGVYYEEVSLSKLQLAEGGVRELGVEGDAVPAMPSPTGCSPIGFAHRRQSWVPCYQQGSSTAPNKVEKEAHGLTVEGALSGVARTEDRRGAAV